MVSAIAILPDDVLLEIFSFYLAVVPRTETWHTLVHVCRRWRSIVFASPRRLDLRLVCTVRTRVKEMLDIWPILPIEIWATGDYATAVSQGKGEDNIAATLEHKDRVYEITVESFSSAVLERIGTAMQEPFPALTDIRIASLNKTAGPVFPQEFLGGSAQHLRSCFLYGIAIPGIRQLLLSATNLVELHLWKINIFPIPRTFRPRLWPLACPRCPVSNDSGLDSNPLNLAQTGIYLRAHESSSPLSPAFGSKASANTSKTLFPESASLYSKTLI